MIFSRKNPLSIILTAILFGQLANHFLIQKTAPTKEFPTPHPSAFERFVTQISSFWLVIIDLLFIQYLFYPILRVVNKEAPELQLQNIDKTLESDAKILFEQIKRAEDQRMVNLSRFKKIVANYIDEICAFHIYFSLILLTFQLSGFFGVFQTELLEVIKNSIMAIGFSHNFFKIKESSKKISNSGKQKQN